MPVVDVGSKPVTDRRAVATGRIALRAETVEAIRAGRVPKGDVLSTARIAGIQAAKRTPDWIPMCHPVALVHAETTLETEPDGITVTAEVRAADRTGVEMEALTAVAAACLSIYDMCKGIDPSMTIGPIRLVEKTKAPRAADADAR